MPSADPVSSLPRYQTAIVAQGPGRLAIQHDAPVPSLAPDMAMVKTEAVAINPVDAKMLDYSAAAGAIHGYVCTSQTRPCPSRDFQGSWSFI